MSQIKTLISIVIIIVLHTELYSQKQREQNCNYTIAFADFDGGSKYTDMQETVNRLKKEIPNAMRRELSRRGYNIIENDYLRVKRNVDVIITGSFLFNNDGMINIFVKGIDTKTGKAIYMEQFNKNSSKYEEELPFISEEVGYKIDLLYCKH
jgi:hypothetical protein